MKRNFIVLFLMLSILPALSLAPLSAQDEPPARSITVGGVGQVNGAPDVAFIQLGAEQVDTDAAEAFSQANAVVAAIRAAIVELGVAEEDIQTTGFNMWVQERFDRQSGAPTGEREFHALNQIAITLRDTAITGDVVNAAIENGANSINGLSFGIDDPSELAREARTLAIADATERAQQIADALGLTLGEPLTISEAPGFSTVPLPEFAAFGRGGGGGGDVSISGGQLTVSVNLTITFALEG